MTRKAKIPLYCLIFTILLIGVARFTHHETQGFRLSKIRSNLFPSSSIPTSDREKEWLSALFQHPFRYLGRGLQSFVFVSSDEQYVIKIFNNRYQRRLTLFNLLSSFPGMRYFAQERLTYFASKMEKTRQSYLLAYQEIPEETGLLYLHLSATEDLPSTLTLIDRLNIAHQINPNEMGFIIQKKVKMAYPSLLEYEEEQAKHAIASLIHLFYTKCEKGIADSDPLIRTNYGFIAAQPFQIDVGSLSRNLSLQHPERAHEEIIHITKSLRHWIEEHRPELLPFLDDQLNSSRLKQ
jgi:hypothetical protein